MERALVCLLKLNLKRILFIGLMCFYWRTYFIGKVWLHSHFQDLLRGTDWLRDSRRNHHIVHTVLPLLLEPLVEIVVIVNGCQLLFSVTRVNKYGFLLKLSEDFFFRQCLDHHRILMRPFGVKLRVEFIFVFGHISLTGLVLWLLIFSKLEQVSVVVHQPINYLQ